MERKSIKKYVVVAAAEKYFVVQDFTAEELRGILNNSVPSSQAAGLVKDQIGPSSVIEVRF
jgi:hypothetical protein